MKTKRVSKLLAVLALGLTLASCGKDNNAGNNVNTFGSPFSVNNNGTAQSSSCPGGSGTLVRFTVIGQNSNVVNGSVQQSGGAINGTSNIYRGRDYGTGDQIAVQKIVNGQQAQFNVQMVICPLQTGQQVQVTNVDGGYLQLGMNTGSGVAGTIQFDAVVGGVQFPNEVSIFSPAQ